MSFGSNIKTARTSLNMSQEKFAELLGVSRQAVSIWESDNGYPEAEKLPEIGKTLNVSLDYLFYGEKKNTVTSRLSDGKISIYSPNENVIVRCNKVASTQQFKGKENEPEYALFAVNENNTSILGGESRTVIGWYRDKDDLAKEIAEINKALIEKQENYTLKYAVTVNRKGLRIKISD